jgi:hypothetical protein
MTLAGEERVRVFTAANRKYARLVAAWLGQVRRLGLEPTVFDLGGLGFGASRPVDDAKFHAHGQYTTTDPNGHARALHKPDIVAEHLERLGSGWYLDADALPVAPLEAPPGECDIAVTVRRPTEVLLERRTARWGWINAGVMYLRRTKPTLEFVSMWQERTVAMGNDQRALNDLLGTDLPRDGVVIERAGLRVACLSTDIFNFYYFRERPPPGVRVLHLKNGRWRHALRAGMLSPTLDLERLSEPAPPRFRWTGPVRMGA